MTAIRSHHAQFAETLQTLTGALLTAVASGSWEKERRILLDWYTDELLPHAELEEEALYDVGGDLDGTGLLVSGLAAEHRSLAAVASELEDAREPVDVVAAAAAGLALLTVHLGKEHDLLVPALDAAGMDLGCVLRGMSALDLLRPAPAR